VREITIPELSLVVLIGTSSSGKSTFAHRHFKPSEIVSSDFCRGLVDDDENSLAATDDAFDLLHHLIGLRLKRGRLTVVDATNVKSEDRRELVRIAREHHCLPVALVFDLPEKICHERTQQRPDRDFGRHVIRRQRALMRRGLRDLKRQGFRHVTKFRSVEEVDEASIVRTRMWNDKRDEHGPFDVIGDIHGCGDALEDLLARLGYVHGQGWALRHPEGRKAVFLGDLVDRGPRSVEVLRTVMAMVEAGSALCVPGNHDVKLLKKLRGRQVQIRHGLQETLDQIAALPEEERGAFEEQVAAFIDGLVSHYVLDDGRLVVAHAGMKETMQGRGSGKVRQFALYGETTGETDEFGLPVRHDWAAEYRGQAMVVYGHTPAPKAEWLNRTLCLDTGCVFGGKLSALRYPELELVDVPAREIYADPVRPLEPQRMDRSAQHAHDDLLHVEDVLGKRILQTRLQPNISIPATHGAAALEVMSRFAANPKWLIYLPPTMSPCETAPDGSLLERPEEAFAYFADRGVERIVCEEKHMGSRAVVIVCRDGEVGRRRFGLAADGDGICYTRTGRRFFDDEATEQALLERLRSAVDAAGLWEELTTDWLCLDCELMPWSAKAQELLRQQYAAVGSAATHALGDTLAALRVAEVHGQDVTELRADFERRSAQAEAFRTAYRRYCWPVSGIDDYRLAPFHLLASEGAVHIDRDHLWHMGTLARLADSGDPLFVATPHREVDLTDDDARAAAITWWHELTAAGGEGMVVKPRDFIARGKRGPLQPAVKCRGGEYLRIIYGPEYDRPDQIERLRKRGLRTKRSLAAREFALGIEALERFVAREPLRRVHECVFGVLALESEPVDPRL